MSRLLTTGPRSKSCIMKLLESFKVCPRVKTLASLILQHKAACWLPVFESWMIPYPYDENISQPFTTLLSPIHSLELC